MLQCMRSIQFTTSEITEVFDCIAGLLNLGNVQFAEQANQEIKPSLQSVQAFTKAALLLKVDQTQLLKALTSKVATIGNERIESALTLQ